MRTVEECLAVAAGDVTVQTSLLESRLVTSRKLFATFQERFRPGRSARLLRQDPGDAPAACQFENTPYALEPNCKGPPAACATCR